MGSVKRGEEVASTGERERERERERGSKIAREREGVCLCAR